MMILGESRKRTLKKVIQSLSVIRANVEISQSSFRGDINRRWAVFVILYLRYSLIKVRQSSDTKCCRKTRGGALEKVSQVVWFSVRWFSLNCATQLTIAIQ